jgi:hypothetical protein
MPIEWGEFLSDNSKWLKRKLQLFRLPVIGLSATVSHGNDKQKVFPLDAVNQTVRVTLQVFAAVSLFKRVPKFRSCEHVQFCVAKLFVEVRR